MSGHGWVNPRPDGAKARCGGPAICPECARELADKEGAAANEPQPLATATQRAYQLTTLEMHRLDRACLLIREAFGTPPYLVGSAGFGDAHRDVDVRLILGDEEFAVVCPTKARWEILCLAFTVYLGSASGLPVDFQIQRMTEANERHSGPRNPLGMSRTFAGGGDATPEWSA